MFFGAFYFLFFAHTIFGYLMIMMTMFIILMLSMISVQQQHQQQETWKIA